MFSKDPSGQRVESRLQYCQGWKQQTTAITQVKDGGGSDQVGSNGVGEKQSDCNMF